MMDNQKFKRIGGYLHRIIPIFDSAGKILNYAVSPLMVEFRLRDFMQVVVGASILAFPIALTEEVWKLGEELPLINAFALSGLGLIFIAFFVYFNFYRYMFREHKIEYVKRVLFIYFTSLTIVAIVLTILQKCPWQSNLDVAIKRVLIGAFPAAMSASISDILK
jgi:uncharacterized membrane protein